MTSEFEPCLGILAAPQRRLWEELAAIPPEFVLYGGTAVALHLGHRQLRRLPQATKDYLAKAAREVDLDHLPAIAKLQ